MKRSLLSLVWMVIFLNVLLHVETGFAQEEQDRIEWQNDNTKGICFLWDDNGEDSDCRLCNTEKECERIAEAWPWDRRKFLSKANLKLDLPNVEITEDGKYGIMTRNGIRLPFYDPNPNEPPKEGRLAEEIRFVVIIGWPNRDQMKAEPHRMTPQEANVEMDGCEEKRGECIEKHRLYSCRSNFMTMKDKSICLQGSPVPTAHDQWGPEGGKETIGKYWRVIKPGAIFSDVPYDGCGKVNFHIHKKCKNKAASFNFKDVPNWMRFAIVIIILWAALMTLYYLKFRSATRID